MTVDPGCELRGFLNSVLKVFQTGFCEARCAVSTCPHTTQAHTSCSGLCGPAHTWQRAHTEPCGATPPPQEASKVGAHPLCPDFLGVLNAGSRQRQTGLQARWPEMTGQRFVL